MISKLTMMNPVKTLQIAFTIVIVSLATTAFATAAEPKADASATPANQKQFASPKEAADALVQAAASFDTAALKEIAQEKHDDSKVNQYAQKIISTPGKHDGLAWKNPDGTWGGPVGEEVAKALEQGYTDQGKPYHGYYFKVLKKQGPAAPGGEIDFVVGGTMIGGFGLAAAPAEYRVTGVKTLMVGPDGVAYEKDLGPDTLKTFQAMDSFNPDKTWKVTEDEWPEEDEDQGGTE